VGNLYTIFAYLTVNAFATYTLSRVYRLVFGEVYVTRTRYVLSYLLFLIINSSLYLAFDEPLITMSSNVIMYIALTYNYKSTLIKRIAIALSIFAFSACIEILIIAILRFLNFNALDNIAYMPWVLLLHTLTIFIIASTLLHSNSIRNFKFLRKRQSLYLIIVALVILVLSYGFPAMVQNNPIKILMGTVALCVISVFLFIFMDSMVKTSQERAKRIVFESQNQLYQNELEIVKKYQTEIKTIKHDMEFHIQTIHELLKNKEISKAKEYTAGLIKLGDIIVSPINTNITELDSILNYKIGQAKQLGIDFNPEIRIEQKCDIDSHDYVSLIGNLMTNAIEATDKVVDKQINMVIGIAKGMFYFEIQNPYDNYVINIDGAYLSTKENRIDHGYGISHVKSIVAKYNGSIVIDEKYNDEKIFRVEVLLYNKSKSDD